MELNQTSRREADNITYSEQNDALTGKSVSATLLYNLKCEKVVGNIPEECSCERPIKVKYRYDTRLEATSDASATLYDSNTNAVAQEVAALTLINEKTDAISIADAGAWMAASECKKDFNEEFTLAVFDLGTSIFNSYSKVLTCAGAAAVNPILGVGCEIYTSIIKKQKTQKIIDDIKTLITTPIYNATECTKDKKDGGIGGYANVTLKAGEPLQITLNTGSLLSCKGKRTWTNNARITSSYSLAGVIESGTVPNKPYCCSRAVANWTLASAGVPLTVGSLLQTNGTEISIQGLQWNKPMNPLSTWHGAALAREIYGDNQITIDTRKTEAPAISSTSEISIDRIEVYDLSGRLVLLNKNIMNQTEIKEKIANNSALFSGFYLVKLVNTDGSSSIEKVSSCKILSDRYFEM